MRAIAKYDQYLLQLRNQSFYNKVSDFHSLFCLSKHQQQTLNGTSSIFKALPLQRYVNRCKSHIIYQMKSQKFPIFWQKTETDTSFFDSAAFLSQLSTISDHSYLENNYKQIEQNILIMTKQQNAEQYLINLVNLLCQMFKATQFTLFLTLMRTAINVETKYENTYRAPIDDVLSKPSQNLDSSTPIALPYYPQAQQQYGAQMQPVFGPQLPQGPLVIAVHADSAISDVNQQQKNEDSRQFFKQDNQKVGNYIENKFKVVKRDGISVYFTMAAELISSELMEYFLQKNYLKLPILTLIQLLQLLDYISAPLFTFYFSDIISVITTKTLALIETKASTKQFSKGHFATLLNLYNSLTDRWQEDSGFNRQHWNWQITTRMISHFISSDVSQKQLHAVKSLGQICRKSRYYNYSISEEKINDFIQKYSILEQIYRGDNHPEVISKGQQIFSYVINSKGLSHAHLDLIFNLLHKCHQNLSKSLFNTIFNIQDQHLSLNRGYVLEKIKQLPRASSFNSQTFSLIRKIAMLTPPEDIQSTIKNLFTIIQNHYPKLKQELKVESIKTYYQFFEMGIELETFNQTHALLPLRPVFETKNPELIQKMVAAYISKLQDRVFDQKNGKRFRNILNEGLKLMIQQETRKWQFEEQTFLRILKLLLQCCEEINNDLLGHQLLWQLIRRDNYFAKFIRFYPQDIQNSMIKSLIHNPNKNHHDLECILQLFHLMDPAPRKNLESVIISEYFNTQQVLSKYTLAPQVLAISELNFQKALGEFADESKSAQEKLSWLILMREIIKKEDEKGFGQWGPFQCWNDGEVFIKVFNLSSQSKFHQFQLTTKSYSTLFEIVSNILKMTGQKFEKTKIKLNDKYVQLHELKQQIGSLTPLKKVSLEIYETQECEWFDKTQLFDKDGAFHIKITDALKQLFNNFATQNGRLFPQNIANVFKFATGQQNISVHDSRVTSIINVYSENGQYLTVDEWINFYFQSAQKNAPLVISNLMNLGFKHLFNDQPTFEIYFQDEHQLRKHLAQNTGIYNLLFTHYLAGNQLLNEQLVKTLKILPMCVSLKTAIVQQSFQVFNVQLRNQLYYWYISTILRAVYSNNLRIENCQQWRSLFRQSNYCVSVQNIFYNYLDQFLENFDQYLYKAPLFSIVQNLGCILRDIQAIPDLLRSNVSDLSPFQPDQKVLPHQKRSGEFFDSVVFKLGMLCTKLLQSKMSLRVAEYCTSTLANLFAKNAKDVNTKQLNVLHDLLFHQNDQIRTLFCNFYFLLSNTFKSIKQQFYEINISKKYDTVHKKCKEYFQALTKMLAFQENDKYCIQISSTFQKEISESLQKQPTNQFYETDEALLGKLKVLNQIKIYNPNLKIQQTTIQNINHLLEINSSQQIRNILYAMSASMCDLKSNLSVAIKIMDNLHPSKNSHIRGRNKMGIYNLGCICYINSVVQQLQMIDPFRRGIISTQIQAQQIDFFREFQWIIYQLSFGQRIYIVPENFCLNYLDHNGKPINIRQQHDADQFLNQLFDRLEVRLKSTNTNGLISDNFRGQIVNVINCQKCFHKKQRVENFYVLSIQMKNQKNLQQCLDKYAETQFICDYFCDYCESKVETIQKYHRFQSLPPFLFIHLQRLVFDLQSMYKIKLDHPIQFPLEIDLSSYFNSECGEPAIYVLKGFVVHIGSSEGGHYYSLIRCDGDWVKFDDTRIDPWIWNEGSHDKNNAYLLLYQKKTTQSIQKVKTDITIGNKSMMQSVKKDNYNLLKEQIFLQPSFSKFITQVMQKLTPPEILKIEDVIEIWQQPYHPQVHQITDDFAQQLNIAFEVAFKYFKLDIQCRQLNLFQRDFNQMRESQESNSKSMLSLQRISYDIMYILHFRPHFAINILAPEFLSTATGNFFSAIYLHRQQKVRQITISFFFKLILIIKSQLSSSFLHPVPHNELIQKLLQKFIVGLSQVGKNSTKMNEFFQLIDRLIKIDSRFGQWFQAHKLGPRLIHLILQNQSGLEGLLPNYPFYTNSFRKNYAITLIIQIVGKLVEFQRDISLNSQDLQIEKKAYLNFELYRRLYHDRYENLCLPTIVAFCSKNNQNFTKKILNFVIQNLNRFSHNDQYIYRYLHLLYSQVLIQDSLQRQRLERLLGIPLLCKRNDTENQQYTINSQTDRLCIYENPLKKVGDQIMQSFLQLLYINRMEQNYFVLYGIKALLTLMTQNNKISNYIQELPGPCLAYPRYTDWISEFLYKGKKNKQQNKSIGMQQKKSMLEDIALQINKYQNMRSDSSEKINEEVKDPSYKNPPYLIGKTAFPTEWTPITIQFNQNLILLESKQENYNIQQKQVINAQYRILFCYNSNNQQEAQVIQYKVQLLCKARLSLPTCYTLHFQRGQFQFALPYSQDQFLNLRFYVFQEQIMHLQQKKQRQEMKKQQKKIQILEKIESNASNMNDFPTINQVYEGPNDIGQAVRKGAMKEESGSEYECPFCCFKTTQFSNRCKQCGQQWGEMM